MEETVGYVLSYTCIVDDVNWCTFAYHVYVNNELKKFTEKYSRPDLSGFPTSVHGSSREKIRLIFPWQAAWFNPRPVPVLIPVPAMNPDCCGNTSREKLQRLLWGMHQRTCSMVHLQAHAKECLRLINLILKEEKTAAKRKAKDYSAVMWFGKPWPWKAEHSSEEVSICD